MRLSKSRYQRAYVDFFEDELVLHGYDWKRVVAKYLLEGKQPLVNNLIGGRTLYYWMSQSDQC